VMDGSMSVQRAFDWAMERIDAMPMVYSSAAPQSVKAMQDKYGREKVAEAIERFMGQLAVRLAEAGVTRLVVGGGETSGAVVTALGVSAFAIGPEIDPGVPALAVEGSPLRLALKSGNFGGLDFYEKAAKVLAGDAA
jgi:3-dehydrotetronate 4-kinase